MIKNILTIISALSLSLSVQNRSLKEYEATRFGKWKTLRTPIKTGDLVLYDMSNDIDERKDYSKRRPGLGRHAKNLLDNFHKPPKPKKKK